MTARKVDAAPCYWLEPIPGISLGTTSVDAFRYHQALAESLLPPAKEFDIELSMLARWRPEETVYVVDEREASGDPPNYMVVAAKARESISEAVVRAQTSVKVDIERVQAPISERIAEKLRAVWRLMILQARYPTERYLGYFPAFYEFSASLPFGGGSAQSMGPPPGTCPADLAAIGHRLADYARAAPADRPKIEKDLLRRAAKLEERLKKSRKDEQDAGAASSDGQE